MRIVTIPKRQVPKKRRRHIGGRLIACVILLVPTILYFRPLPAATISISTTKEILPAAPSISWPSGQVAFSAEGYDFLSANQPDKIVSTASIAKIITALCVLEAKPLKIGETGPSITMTASDVQRYETEVTRDGTAFAVAEGDTLTEYEMLEAILLPSANNIADSAAIWAFGSLDAYHNYAQSFVTKHGMTSTVIGPDASGYDPATRSTPSDLVKLAKLALKNDVVMQITGKPVAVLQGTWTVTNHNTLTSKNGVTGLKTGRNDENSGGLLFTARLGSGDRAVNVAGIVIDAGSLNGALSGTSMLLKSLEDEFPTTVIAPRQGIVGTVRTAWGTSAEVTTRNQLSLQHWSGSTVYSYSKLYQVSGAKQESVGKLYAKADGREVSSDLVIAKPAAAPSFVWRITHVR